MIRFETLDASGMRDEIGCVRHQRDRIRRSHAIRSTGNADPRLGIEQTNSGSDKPCRRRRISRSCPPSEIPPLWISTALARYSDWRKPLDYGSRILGKERSRSKRFAFSPPCSCCRSMACDRQSEALPRTCAKRSYRAFAGRLPRASRGKLKSVPSTACRKPEYPYLLPATPLEWSCTDS